VPPGRQDFWIGVGCQLCQCVVEGEFGWDDDVALLDVTLFTGLRKIGGHSHCGPHNYLTQQSRAEQPFGLKRIIGIQKTRIKAQDFT